MSSVVLDSEALARLRQADGPVEIRDQAGRLVGYFTPPSERPSRATLCGGVDVPFTEEDLDRYESEPGGRALEQILNDLEKRS
jgi:hypothetical protein